jgi:hypothetical protein
MVLNKKIFATLTAFILIAFSMAQKAVIYDLRENSTFDSITMNKTCLHIQNYPKNDLNYVKTLLYTWKLVKTISDSVPSDKLLQSLSAVGDIQSVNLLSSRAMAAFPQLNDSTYVNAFKHRIINNVSAKEFILKSFRGKEVIMFNEAHDRPQTRALLASLLADFKKAGVTCLALETLVENGNLKELDGTTGIYTQEPMAGEVLREGLRLGFKLIPYENIYHYKRVKRENLPDTLIVISQTSNQRDSAQARNLYDRIKTTTGIEKTLVLGGYGHIAESFKSSFVSMAMNFKKISGVNPLTIDQTFLMEENRNSPYANKLLDTMLNGDSVFGFKASDLAMFRIDSNTYDAYLYHPKTRYIHNRPSWLINSKYKCFVSVKIPKTIKPVLVQAYLADEIKFDGDYGMKIPCDQTFFSEDNCVWLALRKRKKYKIVYRDDKNRIIYKGELKP